MCDDKRIIIDVSRGFSMIELILVIAIGILLLAVTMPIGFDFYRSVLAEDVSEEIMTIIRRASVEARLGKNDIAHGVFFDSASVTYFQGESYVARVASADEVTPIASGVTISGIPSEIIFAKHTGLPSATGTISISLYSHSHAIYLSDSGIVSELLPTIP